MSDGVGAELTAQPSALAFATLREQLGDVDWTLARWRAGVDYVADLVSDGDGVVVGVLRRPHDETVSTGYDGLVDYADLIETEVAVLRLLRAHDVQVPDVLAWHRREQPRDVSWMFLEYVPHEPVTHLTPALQHELGQLTRRIHAITPTALEVPALHREQTWTPYMTRRLELRLAAAAAYCTHALPVDGVVARAAGVFTEREESARSLLHLDLRPDNLCVRSHEIAAVLDVSNALIGDPLLELARIRANGGLTSAFLDGYGQHALTPHELLALDVYELDTCAMLTVVAREEMDDPVLFEASRARTIELCAAALAD